MRELRRWYLFFFILRSSIPATVAPPAATMSPGRQSGALKHFPGLTRIRSGSVLTYPLLGVAFFVAFVYLSFGDFKPSPRLEEMSFVERNDTQFVVDGRAFYVNGWNSYWMMDQAAEESSKSRVTEMFQIGEKMGMTVCRTWAFNGSMTEPTTHCRFRSASSMSASSGYRIIYRFMLLAFCR